MYMEFQARLSTHNHTDDDDGCAGGAPNAVLDFRCSQCGEVVGRAEGWWDDDVHYAVWEVFPARMVRDGPERRSLDFLSLHDLAGTRHGGRRRRHVPKGIQWECVRNGCKLPSVPRSVAEDGASRAYQLGLPFVPVGRP